MITAEQIENEIENVLAHGNNRADIAFLADLYTCRDAIKGVSMTIPEPTSEFARCVNGRCLADILPMLEELLETVMAINPRLYKSFISKL